MNTRKRAKVCLFHRIGATIAALFLSPVAFSQSQFEITIQQFGADEVRGYVQPLGDKFGANLNAGLYHSAAIKDEGFHLRIDFVGMVSVINDEDRVYNATLPAGFVPEGGSYKTATVFGGKGTTFKDVNTGLEYKGSDGVFSANLFPLFVPQLTIGSLWGTEASVRYIYTPPLSGGKLPSSTLWGAGVRHDLSQYFGAKPPIDVSLGVFYSNFSVGDVLECEGTALDVQISKSLFLFTFYGGFALERSSMNLHYTYRETETSTPTLVDLALDGGNTFRFTTGLQIDLQAITLYADANFGYVQHFAGGIGFGF